jgi:hypothetical protein
MESQPGLLEQMWETLRLKHRRFRTEDHQQSALDSWQKNKYAPNICNPAIGKSPFPLRDTLLDLTSPSWARKTSHATLQGFGEQFLCSAHQWFATTWSQAYATRLPASSHGSCATVYVESGLDYPESDGHRSV